MKWLKPYFNQFLDQPIIIRSSNKTNIIIGNTASLLCQIQGYPNPTITWLKNDMPVPSSKYTTDSSGLTILTIENATVLDNGKYQCKGVNNLGKASSPAALITVGCELLPTIFFVLLRCL